MISKYYVIHDHCLFKQFSRHKLLKLHFDKLGWLSAIVDMILVPLALLEKSDFTLLLTIKTNKIGALRLGDHWNSLPLVYNKIENKGKIISFLFLVTAGPYPTRIITLLITLLKLT